MGRKRRRSLGGVSFSAPGAPSSADRRCFSGSAAGRGPHKIARRNGPLRGYATTMTKAEIVQALYTRVGGFSKKESADLVDLVFETMKETLGRGEKIKISGFGNFVLRDKRQRPGRNPQTGEPIKISERRVLTFKPSQVLKHTLNTKNKSIMTGA